eukprot:1758526-Pyramimonas_sp.AAC.1
MPASKQAILTFACEQAFAHERPWVSPSHLQRGFERVQEGRTMAACCGGATEVLAQRHLLYCQMQRGPEE